MPKEEIIHPAMYAKQFVNHWILKKYKLVNLLYDRMLIVTYKLNSSGKNLVSRVNEKKLVIKSNLIHCLVVRK